MPVIKDRQVVENQWQFAADADALPQAGDVSVPLALWLEQKDALTARGGALGVRLRPEDDFHALADDLPRLALIELEFPLFGDGRLFSFARLLRDQYGYAGEIRAVGYFLTDQIYFLSRVGVNAFDLDDKRVALGLASFSEFTVHYQ